MNLADSEEMGRALRARGLTPAARQEDADWILVNTCTVRQHAEDRALSRLGRLRPWKAGDPRRRLVVVGCAAERIGESLRSRFPHVDLVVGAKSLAQFDRLLAPHLDQGENPFDGLAEGRDAWPHHLTRADGPPAAGSQVVGWSTEADYTSFLGPSPVTAYVTIMRGCNYSCAYCVVPAVRGREVYRPAASVLEEVRQKAARGLPEVMLLGQTVNSYRPSPAADGVADFSDLLRAVNAVPGVRRIRFMSPHPHYVDDRFARAMAECENVCPHIHLPVQSGADAVLKRMRRNYTRADFLRRLDTLRRAVPGLAVTTDLIAGFPGETEADFADTLSLTEQADFDGAFCFKYSPRPGTEAAGLADDVPEAVKEERHARLLKLTESLARRKVRGLRGRRRDILVENALPRENGAFRYEGRDAALRKILFSSGRALRAGEFAEVRVTGASGRTLRGEMP